ncbi:MAG TPA: NUDIX domain-containing protein [Paracoccus solventivorans]|uniref:NUDIX domain-containing protein n=1 Tax=Paracoccus solventivorans TaxID=53463 RepID=UPI002C7015EE|nr:NUDIX domain-containing protein [Paracoccus solventivorans]HMM08744.1 NUDIX domain-containing protein [Paracoccus solventivorans]
MVGRVLLVGVLAAPEMLAALGLAPAGPDIALPGALRGGGAGIGAGDWPQWDRAAPGVVAAIPVAPNPQLARYAAIMGLAPVETGQGRVLGTHPTGGADREATRPPDPVLAAGVAAELLALDPAIPAELLRAHLPGIAWRADSRRRARGAPRRGELAPAEPGPDRLRIEHRSTPYLGHFAVEQLRLRHLLHRGGWSGAIERAVFISGDAVVVLPWDPGRDRVLLVEQFRAGPAARGDPQPWLLEPVAGRIDPGDTPAETARREAGEEAGVTLSRLIPVPGSYPSPGSVAEYIYAFIGIAELPDGVAGIAGLESESEDIRSHVLDRARLTEMALAGQIVNAPLLILALWLDRMAGRLRRDLTP